MVILSNRNAKFDLISWKVENEENVYKNFEFDKTENINITGYAGTYNEKNDIKAISWHDTDYDNEILSNTLKKDELIKIT